MQTAGLTISAGLHAALIAYTLAGVQLFSADQEEISITIVDASIEFAAPADQATAPPAEDEVAALTPPPEEPAVDESSLEFVPADEDPVEDEAVENETPEEAPAETPPEPAPYAVAPPTPAILSLDRRALEDEAADRTIREVLPRVAAAPPPDAAPEVDASTVNPLVPPPQPEPLANDAPPIPEPPAPPPPPEEPEQEPEQPQAEEQKVAAAPAPSRRPARPRPPPEPASEPTPEPAPASSARTPQPSFLDTLDQAVASATQNPPQSQQARPDAIRAAPISAAEKDGLVLNLRSCWRPPDLGGSDPRNLVIGVEFTLNQEGFVASRIAPTRTLQTDKQRAFFRSVQAAIERCQPFRLPPEKYDQWRWLRIDFDPVRGVNLSAL